MNTIMYTYHADIMIGVIEHQLKLAVSFSLQFVV